MQLMLYSSKDTINDEILDRNSNKRRVRCAPRRRRRPAGRPCAGELHRGPMFKKCTVYM